MAKRKKKIKVPAARDLIVLDMILTKKGGTHRDKKRESKNNPPTDD